MKRINQISTLLSAVFSSSSFIYVRRHRLDQQVGARFFRGSANSNICSIDHFELFKMDPSNTSEDCDTEDPQKEELNIDVTERKEVSVNEWRGGLSSVRVSPKSSGERHGPNIHTHYVFLVHGWLGNSKEFAYLETSINQAMETHTRTDKSATARLVTHCTTKNNGRTTDGIAGGGTRLAVEIREFILDDLRENDNSPTKDNEYNVGISFVGNSLGGLYSRYALSKIPTEIHLLAQEEGQSTQHPVFLHKELFITTVTPHLGVASHTFFGVPRALEHVIGRALMKTGKDLFRIDKGDLIHQMCTNYESYLKPLAKFRKRIAYINAFQTDFQVPTSTAAFLDQHSTSSHSVPRQDDSHPFIVAVANTVTNKEMLLMEETEDHNMSLKLDAMGWEKVFIDVRQYIPGFTLPFIKKSSREKWNEFIQSRVEQTGKDVINVESRELYNLMKGSEKKQIPVGHQVMIANSKNEAYESFTKTGRPVMDHLGKQIVETLFL